MTALELQGCIGIFITILNAMAIPSLLIIILYCIEDLKDKQRKKSVLELIGWITEGCGLLVGLLVGLISTVFFLYKKEWSFVKPLYIYVAIVCVSWVLLFIESRISKKNEKKSR